MPTRTHTVLRFKNTQHIHTDPHISDYDTYIVMSVQYSEAHIVDSNKKIVEAFRLIRLDTE